MKIMPRGTRVVLKRKETEHQTKSGILLAQASEVKYVEGTVVAVGPEVPDLNEGDYVLFDKFCTYQDVEDLILIDESDILAILPDGSSK